MILSLKNICSDIIYLIVSLNIISIWYCRYSIVYGIHWYYILCIAVYLCVYTTAVWYGELLLPLTKWDAPPSMIPLSACARTIASGTPFLFLKAVGPYFLVHPRNYTSLTNGISSLSSKFETLYTGLPTMHMNRLLLLVVDSSDQFQFHLSRDSHIVKVIL